MKHDFNLSNTLNSISDDLAQLQPLASTMSKALNQVGIIPPNELADLAGAFHSQIVAPISQVQSGNIGDQIVNFFKTQISDLANGKKLSLANQTIANGGNAVIKKLTWSEQISAVFSNPFFVGGLILFIALSIWLIVKK